VLCADTLTLLLCLRCVGHAQNGSTPLYTAAQNGYASVVTLLVERGADVNAKDKVRHATHMRHCCTLRQSDGPCHTALQDGKKPMDVAKIDATRAALRSGAASVPSDVAALLSALSLSHHGTALVDVLGVSCVADLALLSEAHLKEEVPAMKVAERLRLLKAAAEASKVPVTSVCPKLHPRVFIYGRLALDGS
jgi:hypothetical protein